MNVLNYFGIYEDEINKADEMCQDVLCHAGLENRYDEMMNDALDYFYRYCNKLGNTLCY